MTKQRVTFIDFTLGKNIRIEFTETAITVEAGRIIYDVDPTTLASMMLHPKVREILSELLAG